MLWSILSAVIGFFAGAAAAAGAALLIATCAKTVKARRSKPMASEMTVPDDP